MSIYITFKHENIPTSKPTFIEKAFIKLLYFILPKANPDFDSQIDLVSTWYLEFENIESIPIREVGLDFENQVILKMPFKKNYGYWTDNLLKYSDFEKQFQITTISKDILWKNGIT